MECSFFCRRWAQTRQYSHSRFRKTDTNSQDSRHRQRKSTGWVWNYLFVFTSIQSRVYAFTQFLNCNQRRVQLSSLAVISGRKFHRIRISVSLHVQSSGSESLAWGRRARRIHLMSKIVLFENVRRVQWQMYSQLLLSPFFSNFMQIVGKFGRII